LTVVVGVTGATATAALVVAGRRAALADRFRAERIRAGWRLPPRVRARLVDALGDADVARAPEEVVELWAVAVLAVGIVAFTLAPALALPGVVAALVAGPAGLWTARARRERRFTTELPGVLEQVAAELRSGGTVVAAVERLADADSAVAPDLRRVRARARLGLSWPDALAGWSADHDAPGVRAATGALAVASSLGGRAADAIDALAASLRHQLDAAAEARALSAQGRLSAVVVGAAPLGYLVFSVLVDRRVVDTLVGTGVGRLCLAGGLALEGAAALWIRRIVRPAAPS
jgi:tight adherence protein B